jgi:hypothetical protein
MRRRMGLAAVALAALLGLPGCWVWIDSNPRNVEQKFASALEKVADLQAIPADQRGRPRKVRVLVYDSSEDHLISVSAPMWLVRRLAEHAGEEARNEMDDAGADGLGRARRHGLTMDRILDGSKGLMLQADEDGERILVWVE